MKIVVGVHQFLPECAAGTELIAYYLARELRNRGHEVVVVTGSPMRRGEAADFGAEEDQFDGLRVVRMRHGWGERDPGVMEGEYDDREVYRWMKGFLERERPEVVHFVHLKRLTAGAIDACVETGTPSVFTATDFWGICPTAQMRLTDGEMCAGPREDGSNCVRHLAEMKRAGWVNLVPEGVLRMGVRMAGRGWFGGSWSARQVKALVRRAGFLRERLGRVDRIVVPSRMMGEMLVAQGIDAGRVVHLPYGIEVARVERVVESGGGALRVAYVGQIAEHKGCHVLVEAVRRFPREVAIRVRLHGDIGQFPEYVARLREMAGDDGRIEFAGRFDHGRVGAVLAEADVVVCPSLWRENTPLVIYEAMDCGVPVIASNGAGMTEVVKPEVNGLLFAMGDSAALARALLRINEDRALLSRLAANTEAPMTLGLHVNALEALYRQVARGEKTEA